MSKYLVYQLVITGGPCAGKSTCLVELYNKLTDNGFRVIVVPETATEVITAGISPADLPEHIFQGNIIRNSVAKEMSARAAAEWYSQKSPVVILYDRGIPDSLAYMSHQNYCIALKPFGLNEYTAREEYDRVFHLVTAAKGAEHAYTTANNTARRETVEQARAQDDKTMAAWNGVPSLKVIDNSDKSFEAKVKRLVGEVLGAVGLPVPTEVEKKYLIEKPSLEDLLKYGRVSTKIHQTYLPLHADSMDTERRVRRCGANNIYAYSYTEKIELPGQSGRIKRNRNIDHREYQTHIATGIGWVDKTRESFIRNGQYFKMDTYPYQGWRDRAILEIELTDLNQSVDLPPFAHVIADVTDDKDYRNSHLAKSFMRQ